MNYGAMAFAAFIYLTLPFVAFYTAKSVAGGFYRGRDVYYRIKKQKLKQKGRK